MVINTWAFVLGRWHQSRKELLFHAAFKTDFTDKNGGISDYSHLKSLLCLQNGGSNISFKHPINA